MMRKEMNINDEEGVQRSSDETMDKRENEEEEEEDDDDESRETGKLHCRRTKGRGKEVDGEGRFYPFT
ncbi:hypothetical protein MRB53_028409 [Persea americana]|uniref:Uncharacterized protein n=1 Tax=Persea americana TaxID=3435 RepID=A0ACC2KFG6_PERAE|nr:hypothetical protein MRB53_028409 [Persea americana]